MLTARFSIPLVAWMNLEMHLHLNSKFASLVVLDVVFRYLSLC